MTCFIVVSVFLSSQHSDRERHWKEINSQSQREKEDILEREAMLQAQNTDLQEEIRLENKLMIITI